MIAKYASLDFWHLLETCCHQVVVDKYTTPSPRENKYLMRLHKNQEKKENYFKKHIGYVQMGSPETVDSG